MECFQHYEQTTSFQVQDADGAKCTLWEVKEWDDSNAIERVTYRGPTSGIKVLIKMLGIHARQHCEEDSDGITSLTYVGGDAIDVNLATMNLNLPSLDRERVTRFVATSVTREQETISGSRTYSWDDEASGWRPQGEPIYWTESNYPVERHGECEFKIDGNTYKSLRPVDKP